jgi:hypothetical protein
MLPWCIVELDVPGTPVAAPDDQVSGG